jgi:hypothetical protein
MTIRHYIYIIGVMVASLLAACSKDSGDSTQQVGGEPQEIRVQTNLTKMQTRAITIDNITDYDLKIDAYYHDTETKYLDGTKLHYTGGDPTWVFWDGSAQLHYYWPFEGSMVAGGSTVASTLDFVGFCPYSPTPSYITSSGYTHGSGASFTCNMSSYMTSASQAAVSEYLVALTASQTDAGGAVPMNFRHPFAMVKFAIAEASGTEVKINSISISGLKTSGTCTFNGSTMTWGSHSGGATMSIAEELQYGGARTETTPFLVIPYNYGSTTLTVNGTWTDWSNVTKDVSADVDFNWQPGYIYTYTLTLTKYALIVDTAKFTEQW